MSKGFEAPFTRSYIIAFTPRSGSHFLADLLSGTHVCGHPAEYLPPEDRNGGSEERSAYLRNYLRRGRTGNGVFGAKLSWRQFCRLIRDLDPGIPPGDLSLHLAVQRHLGSCRYLFLRRRDRLRQAISYSRALATGRWVSTGSSPAADPGLERFDPAQIDRLLLELQTFDTRWESFLSHIQANHLTLYYEDVIADPLRYLEAICSLLELSPVADRFRRSARTLRQSDALTEQWLQKYTELKAGPSP